MLRNTPVSVSITVIAALLLINGCGTGVTTQRLDTKSGPTYMATIPDGIPTLTTAEGPQSGTWLITATQQQHEQTIQPETTTWEMRRYVTFAPSILLGLIQCPIGGLVQLLSWGHLGDDLWTYGCDRLIGREPVKGRIHTTTTTDHSINERTITAAIPHLPLRIRWEDVTSPTIRLSTNGQGEAFIQLEQLLNQWPVDQPLPTYMWNTPLSIDFDDASSDHAASISLSQEMVQKIRRFPEDPLDPQRLPQQPVVKVKTTNPIWQTQVENWLIQAGWCVAANDTLTPLLREELDFQRSGRVSEHTQVPIGTWIPPTLLFTALTQDTEQGLNGHFSLLHIPQGELLREWKIAVPSGQPELLLPLLLSRLHHDLPKPITPCYPPTTPTDREQVIERTITNHS